MTVPRLRILAIAIACVMASPAYALKLEQVLQSSHRHAPQIQRAQAKLAEADAGIQEAQGAFDWELNGSASQRGGIYGGGYVDTQVTRRLADSNARIYAGYRASNADLPVYEDYYNTASAGEVNIGIAFALLRDRIIDDERFRFRDAVLAKKQQEAEAYLVTLRTQFEAMVAYAQWLADGHALQTMEELAGLARERQSAMNTQVREGDIARIFLTENAQNIARREAQIADARRKLARSAQRLSLYLRDDAGNPMVPDASELPPLVAETPALGLDDVELRETIRKAQALRPEQIAIEFGVEREQNRLALSENLRLPKLDLALEGAQGLGRDAAQRAEEEGRALLRLSIPLQQNTADGRVRGSQARLKSLELEQRLLNDQIATDIRAIAATADATADEIEQAEREIDAAADMRAADTQRFANGDVDFFVLNMREERVAEAKLRRIAAERIWLENLAMFYFMTLDKDKLVPQAEG
jgi:outer membrane protein TolC